MEIKNVSQALKLQKELSATLEANLKKLRGDKSPTLAATMREQEKLLTSAKAELVNSEKAKEASLQRWDMKIEERKAKVKRLEKDLQEMKRKIEEVKKGGRKKVARQKKKTPARPRKKS